MAKKREYVIGIIRQIVDKEADTFKPLHYTIKYVTSIGEHKVARWEAGKEAKVFSEDMAKETCVGLVWNGITAMPILKCDYLTYKNLEEN